MKLYLDSAHPIIKDWITDFHLDGATSNPTILRRDQTNVETFLSYVPEHKTAFVQLVAPTVAGMLEEARLLQSQRANLVLKVPVHEIGLKAIVILKQHGFSVLATAIHSFDQGLLALACGADYLAPYVNRMDKLGRDGVATTYALQDVINKQGLSCEIVGASFSNTFQIRQLMKYGIASVTIPLDLFKRMLSDLETDQAVRVFAEDFRKI